MEVIEQLVAIRNALDVSLIQRKKSMLHAHAFEDAVLSMGRTTLRAFGWNVAKLHIGDREEDPDDVIVYLDITKSTCLPQGVKSVNAHIEHVYEVEILDIEFVFDDCRRVNYDMWSQKVHAVSITGGDYTPVRHFPTRLIDLIGKESTQVNIMCMMHDAVLNRFPINSATS